jgi:prophage antirepressor-like protein
MNRNKIVKSVSFGSVQCDIYKNNEEYYMTREQIGRALEYSEPSSSIEVIHRRNKERLDKFSTAVKMTGVDGKQREHTLYNRKGIMEICRHSSQPKANIFMDWVWDIMDGIISGRKKITNPEDKQKRLELYAESIKTRKAKLILEMAKAAPSGISRDILLNHAAKELTGEDILPLPAAEHKEYTATEIGDMFGTNKNNIGKLAAAHNLKIPEYGRMVNGKSPYSPKEVQTWVYFETAIPQFAQLLGKSSAN